MRVITLARKPLTKGVSVAENVLRHGTGGLNIDGCRLACGTEHIREGVQYRKFDLPGAERSAKSAGAFAAGNGFTPTNHKGGRWPSNVILEHRPECCRVGTKKVKGITGTAAGKMAGHEDETGIYNQGWAGTDRANEQCGFVDDEGNEVVADWDCVEGCPVPVLDGQGGHSVTGKRSESSREASVGRTAWYYDNHQSQEYPGDSGGASRFFKQVKSGNPSIFFL